MTSLDNFADYDKCRMLDPANKTATATSNPVDLKGYNACTIEFMFSAASNDTLSGSIYWTCKLTECDTVGGTYTDVDDTEVINGTTPSNSIVVDANGELSTTYRLGYKGNMRFVKGVVTATGTHTYGNVIGVEANLGHQRMGPPAQASRDYAS